MRLPKDPDNWSLWHVDRAIEDAWRKFKQYEDHVDFTKSQERNDRWFVPYMHAREQAVMAARAVCSVDEVGLP